MKDGYSSKQSRTKAVSPELIISYLSYALEDVRALSPRSARMMELLIGAILEDTRVNEPSELTPHARLQ